MALFGAGYSGDLHQFDVSLMRWTLLNNQIRGARPAIRVYHGFAILDNRAYIFGGFNTYGGIPILFFFFETML